MAAVDAFTFGYVDDLTADEFAAMFDAEPTDVWGSDPATLTDWGLADGLRQLQEQRARLAAREAEFLRAIVGRDQRVRDVAVIDDEGSARSFELIDEAVESAATAMRQAVGSVRRRITVARALAHLPVTSRALECGAISPEHADAIARTSDGLPAALVPTYEARVVRRARLVTPGQTASFARRVRAGLDAPGEEARRQAAFRHVDVRIWAEDDGLACLQARLPLADAVRLHAALEDRTRRVPFDPDESIGQRRVRALVDAVCGSPSHSSSDSTSGSISATTSVPVALQVTVDLGALLALAASPAEVPVPGHGREAITVGALRELLADPDTPVVLRRLVTDPLTGRVIDRGRSAYRVTDALRAFLVARDATCRFPLCSRSAGDCDVDHVTPWGDGGTTDVDNLLPLCRRHHVLKTHAGWAVVENRSDGTVVWRAPDGREIVSPPWNPREVFEPRDPDVTPRIGPARRPRAGEPPPAPPPLRADGFPF